MYNPLLWSFLVGALLPLFLWLYLRRVRVHNRRWSISRLN
jgi:hypothetical protein